MGQVRRRGIFRSVHKRRTDNTHSIDWIPPYLQGDTQVSLRVEMEKARSQSDVPGYIYTFEIRGVFGGLAPSVETYIASHKNIKMAIPSSWRLGALWIL